jgi:hypothetical protein
MTRTILTGLATVTISLLATLSAEACVLAEKPVAALGFDRVFPNASGAALRKEGELRGQEFLVSLERCDRRCRTASSLLRLEQLDRAAREAEKLHRNRNLNLVRLTAPDWLIDAGIELVAGNLC